MNIKPEIILILQPTSPLRTQKFLKDGISLAIESKKPYSSVLCVREKEILSGKIDKDGYYKPSYSPNTRKQELNPNIVPTGSFYLLKCSETLLKNSFFGEKILPFHVTESDYFADIDTFEEFKRAENSFRKRLKTYEPILNHCRKIYIPKNKKKKLKIAGITTNRSDFGIMEPLYKFLMVEKKIDFSLIVTGNHFSKKFGNSINEIKASGIRIAKEVAMPDYQDKGKEIFDIGSVYTKKFGEIFQKESFDLVLFLGDRFECLPIAYAGLLSSQSFGHLHGGELTLGAMDDSIRHCLTKLSHLHFVVNEECASRIAQMGEEPWRIFVTGSPSIDVLKKFKPMPRSEFYKNLKLVKDSLIMVTLHPETLYRQESDKKVDIFFESINEIDKKDKVQWLFSSPAPDPGYSYILKKIKEFKEHRNNVHLIENLGRKMYLNGLYYADLLIGNSSSGLIESPSFELPVINVGKRQEGRMFAENVLSIPYEKGRIVDAFFMYQKKLFKNIQNPYGEGLASKKIMEILCSLPDKKTLLKKKFFQF